MSIIGPGSVQQDTIAPKPSLEGSSEYEYVTILNPLKDDFQVLVAQDIPVNVPFQIRNGTGLVQSERDVSTQYGIPLKNPDHTAKKYIYNQAVIPAGMTMNFKGNEAQVVVKQLVDAILQIEKKSRLLSDPVLRKEVEDRIIMKRGSVQDILDSNFVTPRQQLDEAIKQSNEANNEKDFPGLSQAVGGPETGATDTPNLNLDSKNPVGRPAKANS